MDGENVMAKKKTHEEFVGDLSKVHGKGVYILLEEYKGASTKILVKHNCGYKWEITPNHLLCGIGCPICGKEKRIKNRTKTHEEFIQRLKKLFGEEYTVLGEYIGTKNKILIRHNCKKCNNHQWKIKPNHLLQRHGCPVCGGREAKLGVNTIWDTDKWMIDLGVSEEDAKRYSHSSGQKIIVKCPDCGREKKIAISCIYRDKSIRCSCGDGKSYPEKFIMSVLEQLNVNFKVEYSPDWIKPKRYDFYIKDNNCIIETHGGQHYEKGFEKIKIAKRKIRTFQEEKRNDKYKKEMALQNGIKYYIELDCRESNMEYIKNSILNSELANLFNLSNIDWNKCAEFANKNIVREVCDYWNNKRDDKTTTDVGKIFNLDRTTIRHYLKKGVKLGWCNYNAKEEMKKSALNSVSLLKKKVEIFKNGQSLGVFESCAELERRSEELLGIKFSSKSISSVCTGKRKQYKGFTFKYVEKLKTQIKVEEI